MSKKMTNKTIKNIKNEFFRKKFAKSIDFFPNNDIIYYNKRYVAALLDVPRCNR